MKSFNLDPEIRLQMALRPRQVQVELARLSHLKLNLTPTHYVGPFKYEGGIMIDGHSIIVFHDCVQEDAASTSESATLEEIAVVMSLLDIQAGFRSDPVYLESAPTMISGDPLRELLDLSHDSEKRER